MNNQKKLYLAKQFLLYTERLQEKSKYLIN